MLEALNRSVAPVWETISKSNWWSYLSETTLWQNSLFEWLSALGTLLVILGLARLFKGYAVARLRRLVGKSATRLDDMVVAVLDATRWYAYLALAVYAASLTLDTTRTARRVIETSAVMIALAQAGLWLQTLVTQLVFRWAEKQGARESTTVAAGISFACRLLVWAGVLLLVLSNLGIEINAVVAGLGVGGVAAALAVQSLLSDVFASMSMYFDRPFDIGDFVIVGDYLGTIQEIGVRTTRIASLGGEQIIFSNSDLIKSRIRNYARMSERRIVFDFGIEYNLPAAKVARAGLIAREVIEGLDGVRLDRAHFKSFGDYSLDFEVVYYVLSPDYGFYMERQHAINLELYRRFEEEGIPFAFPTRTLHMPQLERVVEAKTDGRARSSPARRFASS